MTRNAEHSDDSSEATRRKRLRDIEAEQADLFEGTVGKITVGNAELVGRVRDLENEADKLRIQLGEPPRNPPKQARSSGVLGWLALIGGVVVILAGVLFLTPR